MRPFLLISLFGLLPFITFGQQKDVPFNRLTYTGLEHKANSLEEHSHTGLKPVLEGRVNTTTTLGYAPDSTNFYYRFTKTMFGGHLVDIKGDDFRIMVDPQFNFARGREFKNTDAFVDTGRFFNNTRGFAIAADIGNKLSFHTRFYENLTGVPLYLRNHITTRRSFPQQGRPKTFNTNFFDHAWAMGKVSWTPTDALNIQFA